MSAKKDSKLVKSLVKEIKMTKFCKERGWNINELTTGQMLFILNHPDIKNSK
jgi:hypothetical protein